MSTHTPGPWKYDGYGCDIVDSEGQWVADCAGNNVNLIAAAPDLFDALERILKYTDISWMDESKAIDIVRVLQDARFGADRNDKTDQP